MMLRIDKWISANFDPPPHINTVRMWVRTGKIYPPPVKAGRSYYFDQGAKYIPPERVPTNAGKKVGHPRKKEHEGWPAHLYEARGGYFYWINPRDRKTHILGRVPLAEAIQESNAANLKLAGERPRLLVDRIETGRERIADLLAKMPTEGLKPNTVKGRRGIDRRICQALGTIECNALSVRDVATLIEDARAAGTSYTAQRLRSRLVSACKKGQALGWMTSNPAALTETVKVRVQRHRLLFADFQAIRSKARGVSLWLENAMLLALVSGQDRSTVAAWEKSSIQGDVAIITRSKTNVRIAIPLAIRLDAIGMSLADVINRCKSTGAFKRHLIHHVRSRSARPRGSPVDLNSISRAFKDARELAGIRGPHSPTFHEIRSLSKRLYLEQGNVDTVALLGHTTEKMSDLYADPRGAEPMKVRYVPH